MTFVYPHDILIFNSYYLGQRLLNDKLTTCFERVMRGGTSYGGINFEIRSIPWDGWFHSHFLLKKTRHQSDSSLCAKLPATKPNVMFQKKSHKAKQFFRRQRPLKKAKIVKFGIKKWQPCYKRFRILPRLEQFRN